MKKRTIVNKGVWIFALVILALALAGCVVSLLWAQWRHAVCYGLIVIGISMFLYTNRKHK